MTRIRITVTTTTVFDVHWSLSIICFARNCVGSDALPRPRRLLLSSLWPARRRRRCPGTNYFMPACFSLSAFSVQAHTIFFVFLYFSSKVAWIPITKNVRLYASHSDFIRSVYDRMVLNRISGFVLKKILTYIHSLIHSRPPSNPGSLRTKRRREKCETFKFFHKRKKGEKKLGHSLVHNCLSLDPFVKWWGQPKKTNKQTETCYCTCIFYFIFFSPQNVRILKAHKTQDLSL